MVEMSIDYNDNRKGLESNMLMKPTYFLLFSSPPKGLSRSLLRQHKTYTQLYSVLNC